MKAESNRDGVNGQAELSVLRKGDKTMNPDPIASTPASTTPDAPATTAPLAQATVPQTDNQAVRPASSERPWWLHWLVEGNPFYILSAVLLLYSMRCLSLDSRIFSTELPQLVFNFSSFQFYELLLAGTAIVLARRCIWYDSGLLVVLENLFVFVPFILISQALLIEGPVALSLCLTGLTLALGRAASVKKWIPQVNMASALLGIGAGLLLVNVGLPVVTRMLHQNAAPLVWTHRSEVLSQVQWFVLAPVAIALANLLPIALRQNEDRPEREAYFARGWFPVGAVLMWVAGTGAHLYCVSYVYALPWSLGLVTPTLWVAAWTLWRRRSELGEWSIYVVKVMLTLPLLTPVFAGMYGRWDIACVLSLLNVPAFGWIAFKERNALAFRLAVFALALAAASIPESIGFKLMADFERPAAVVGSVMGCILLFAVLSSDPRMGLMGGLIAIPFVAMLLPDTVRSQGHIGVQVGLVFVLIHSLRWNDRAHAGAGTARWLAAFFWLAHSWLWMSVDRGAGQTVLIMGAMALGVYVFTRVIMGTWGPRAVLFAALAAMVSWPLHLGVMLLKNAPVGVVVLAASFALFAAGTVRAFARQKRTGTSRPRSDMGVGAGTIS